MAPLKSKKSNKLDLTWWDGLKAGVEHHKQFITVAEAIGVLEKGAFELYLSWDDAVKFYIDGKFIFNEWSPSKYKSEQLPNQKIIVDLSGIHQFRLEHLESGAFATLNLKLRLL